jgi:hypothetical protein
MAGNGPHTVVQGPGRLGRPRRDRTVNEPAGQFDVHPTLIHGRKQQLLAGAEGTDAHYWLLSTPLNMHSAESDLLDI